MFIAAAEESGDDLVGGRGDAYCGMLNASYNLKLREIKAYIPKTPWATQRTAPTESTSSSPSPAPLWA